MSNSTATAAIGTTAAAELASLKPVKLDAGLVFSNQQSGVTVNGYAAPCAYTPTAEPHYIFQESARDIIVWFLHRPEPLYLSGPTGAGKTSSIKQLAARLQYPVFEVTGHGRLELADLIGHLAVRNGSMVFEYGPLALAMRYGGIFLFNELDLTSPDIAAGLNTILDGAPLCLAENGGELITPNPMFRFAATGNTNGSGDSTGMYNGTLRQNLAFLDRFMLVEVEYPSAATEVSLLTARFPSLPKNLVERMVDYAGQIRKMFTGETAPQIEVTFSTRSLIRWADLTLRYQSLAKQGKVPLTYALDRALCFRASKETRAMMLELAQRVFPANSLK